MDGQFSDDFKAEFRSYYGYHFQKFQPDYTRCCEQVHGTSRADGIYQCRRKNGFGPNGAYCKQHDPDAVKAKAAARQAEYDAKGAREIARWKATAALEPALRQIAAGHNDPRSLAESVIAALDAARRPTPTAQEDT
jgi:hypothetical protein